MYGHIINTINSYETNIVPSHSPLIPTLVVYQANGKLKKRKLKSRLEEGPELTLWGR